MKFNVLALLNIEKLMGQSWEKVKKFIDGEQIDSFTPIEILIFGDFKKHLFSYQVLSPSIPI